MHRHDIFDTHNNLNCQKDIGHPINVDPIHREPEKTVTYLNETGLPNLTIMMILLVSELNTQFLCKPLTAREFADESSERTQKGFQIRSK